MFQIPWGSIQLAGIMERTISRRVSLHWPTPDPYDVEVSQFALEMTAESAAELVQYVDARKKGWFEGVEVTLSNSTATLWLTQAPAGGYRALLAEVAKHIPRKIAGVPSQLRARSRATISIDLFVLVASVAAGWVAAMNLLPG